MRVTTTGSTAAPLFSGMVDACATVSATLCILLIILLLLPQLFSGETFSLSQLIQSKH